MTDSGNICYRCDITLNGVMMTWDEFKHVDAINKKIASNPWNFILGLMLMPWYIIKIFCMAFTMVGIGNKFTVAFLDDKLKLSKTVARISKSFLNYDSYMDDEYHRIMEIPFHERHPERVERY